MCLPQNKNMTYGPFIFAISGWHVTMTWVFTIIKCYDGSFFWNLMLPYLHFWILCDWTLPQMLLANAWCTVDDFQILTDFSNVWAHRHNDRFNRFSVTHLLFMLNDFRVVNPGISQKCDCRYQLVAVVCGTFWTDNKKKKNTVDEVVTEKMRSAWFIRVARWAGGWKLFPVGSLSLANVGFCSIFHRRSFHATGLNSC